MSAPASEDELLSEASGHTLELGLLALAGTFTELSRGPVTLPASPDDEFSLGIGGPAVLFVAPEPLWCPDALTDELPPEEKGQSQELLSVVLVGSLAELFSAPVTLLVAFSEDALSTELKGHNHEPSLVLLLSLGGAAAASVVVLPSTPSTTVAFASLPRFVSLPWSTSDALPSEELLPELKGQTRDMIDDSSPCTVFGDGVVLVVDLRLPEESATVDVDAPLRDWSAVVDPGSSCLALGSEVEVVTTIGVA